MGYPTKVQLISRKKGADQYHTKFPTALAEALGLEKGEVIEWILGDKANITAHRPVVPPPPVTIGKTRHPAPNRVGTNPGALRKAGDRNATMANPYGFAIVAGGSSCAHRSRRHPVCPSGVHGTPYALRAPV